MRTLTQSEVDQLPEGTEVEVTWSGGNGPHRYHVGITPSGSRYAYLASTFVGDLDMCGKRPQTEVRLVRLSKRPGGGGGETKP